MTSRLLLAKLDLLYLATGLWMPADPMGYMTMPGVVAECWSLCICIYAESDHLIPDFREENP